MQLNFLRRLFAALMLVAGIVASSAAVAQASAVLPTCNGKFMNPVTDICWSCIFPIKLAGATIMNMGQEDNGTAPGGSPICWCTNGGTPRIGIPMSFWEPARIIEVVRGPYCFPSLGGIKMDVGIDAPAYGRNKQKTRTQQSFYNVHWYMNPIMYWMEILADNSCLEQGVFDLAYMSELDPMWSDSEATFILNPDASLFTNIVAQAACAADCVAASTGFGLDALFWCAGCQGSMYPLVGWVGSHVGMVQATSLLVQRMTNKMHREGLIWAASGSEGLCGYYIQPIMGKTDYKYQMVYPVRQTDMVDGRCCQPYGRTSVMWGAGRERPTKEDAAYQVFRKRDCCQGAF